MFSARIRAPRAIDRATLEAFVDEVIELVELGPLRDTLVGGSGEGSGLSVEQRKRVSVAVELVANPAIVFMDEPTTGMLPGRLKQLCPVLSTGSMLLHVVQLQAMIFIGAQQPWHCVCSICCCVALV